MQPTLAIKCKIKLFFGLQCKKTQAVVCFLVCSVLSKEFFFHILRNLSLLSATNSRNKVQDKTFFWFAMQKNASCCMFFGVQCNKPLAALTFLGQRESCATNRICQSVMQVLWWQKLRHALSSSCGICTHAFYSKIYTTKFAHTNT